jgi:hypothetical protein
LIRQRSWFFGSLLLLVLAMGVAGQSAAEAPGQAGLVVESGDGQVETLCVDLKEDQISGIDLLTGSGLEMLVDASGGMGVTVCKIGNVGCEHPAEPCFCQCMGGEPCVYWNYYYRDPGESDWTYSALGAVLRKVQPGAVEAWVWGDGKTPPSSDLTFEAICRPATVTPTAAAPSPTAAAAATNMVIAATAEVPGTATPSKSPTTGPAATSTRIVPTPEPTPIPVSDPGGNLAAFLPFGLVVLCLAGIGAFVWMRRR